LFVHTKPIIEAALDRQVAGLHTEDFSEVRQLLEHPLIEVDFEIELAASGEEPEHRSGREVVFG
jgi:hypothetical protein